MIRQAKTFDGVPESVPAARRFVAGVLGTTSFAGTDTMLLITSELATNAIEHSLSARPGGKVSVSVTVEYGHVQVAVGDDGPPDGMAPLVPAECPDPDGESGRGLWLVSALADRWGYDGDGRFWARLPLVSAPARPAEPAADPGALFALPAGGAR